MTNKLPVSQDPLVRKPRGEENVPAQIAKGDNAQPAGRREFQPPPPVNFEAPAPTPPKPSAAPRVSVEAASFEDFEAMLAGSDVPSPRARLNAGDKVSGMISRISDRYLYVELDNGAEGLADITEYGDTLKVGDRSDFYVLSTRGGTIDLGRAMSARDSGLDALEHAYASGLPVEGRVASRNKGGYEIELKGARGFCPMSQIAQGFTEDLDEHLGKTYRFKITDIREDGRNVVVSRTALIQEERRAASEKTLATLEVGQVVTGAVTRLADFGAFVDIGGVEGLVHVSEIGFERVKHPSEALAEGQVVSARVMKIEDTEKGPRIGLSIKNTLDDPWDVRVNDFKEGTLVNGKVMRVEAFGAFVEIAPGLEGLVHISELSHDHVKRASDVVRVGQDVQVEIQSIDVARKRLSLSMKGAGEDVWANIDQHYVAGQQVTGVVENIEDFGVFVSLSGVTALLPRSEMSLPRDATPHRLYKVGQEVEARVLQVDKDRRRMSLTIKSDEQLANERDEASAPRSFTDSPKGMGTFGELLKQKLR